LHASDSLMHLIFSVACTEESELDDLGVDCADLVCCGLVETETLMLMLSSNWCCCCPRTKCMIIKYPALLTARSRGCRGGAHPRTKLQTPPS
jgi:hypothetical protein